MTKEDFIANICDRCNKSAHKVYDIFKDFYGEDFVDLQGLLTPESVQNTFDNYYIVYYASRNIINRFQLTDNVKFDVLLDEVQEAILMELLENDYAFHRFYNITNTPYILVHFPHVRVTNENDRYTEMNHLFAKVKIDRNGELDGAFKLNRSEYSALHFTSGYMHSHVCNIPTGNFEEFQYCCTGEGPINNTIASLNRAYDEDLWRLFCLELSKYVEVESIKGTPYHYLEKLGTGNSSLSNFRLISRYYFYNNFYDELFSDFIKYFIHQRLLKFNYKNGGYSIGMSLPEYMLTISNSFIEWYNRRYIENPSSRRPLDSLYSDGIIIDCIISGGKIYNKRVSSNIESMSNYIGEYVCTFKGKDYNLEITGIEDLNTNVSRLLDYELCMYILGVILHLINFKYGNKNSDTSYSTSKETRYF